MARSWTDDEPGWDEARGEFLSLLRRARANWVRVLLVTLVLVGVAVALRGLRERDFRSTVILGLKEQGFDADTAPPTPRQLKEHIDRVAFSRNVLQKIMLEHEVFPGARIAGGTDVERKVEEMRDAIGIEALNDFYSDGRAAGERAVRVAISFTARDPEVALEVVRALAGTVLADQAEERVLSTRNVASHAEQAAGELESQLLRTRRQLASLRATGDFDSPEDRSAAWLSERRLAERVAQLEAEGGKLAAKSVALSLRRDFEAAGQGLEFQQLDSGHLALPPLLSRRMELTLLAVVLFFALLPVVGLVLGALDSRVRDCDGLLRLGIVPLGHVPSFHGDRFGSLTARDLGTNERPHTT
jgi:hypothetical protein